MIGIERADRIVLAVSGSIAAFKGAALASRLVQGGFDVRVILTRGGARFVTALTFEALTGHPVGTEVWDEQVGASRMGHLELARWAPNHHLTNCRGNFLVSAAGNELFFER